jgi:hypothetical protein
MYNKSTKDPVVAAVTAGAAGAFAGALVAAGAPLFTGCPFFIVTPADVFVVLLPNRPEKNPFFGCSVLVGTSVG